MKLPLIVSALALVTLSLAQDTNVKVTYQTPATSIGKALEGLSAKSGVKLAATANLNDIIILRLNDIPLQQAMDKIAEVTSGTWVKEQDGFRLVADANMRSREQSIERAARAKQISDAINKLMEPIRKVPLLTKQNIDKANDSNGKDPGLNFMMGGGGEPAGRAISKLAYQLGANAFVNIGSGDRVVFSSNANRMQLALPGNTAQIVSDLILEQNVYAEKFKSLNLNDEQPTTDDQSAAAMKFMKEMMAKDHSHDAIKTAPAKVLLIASQNDVFGGITLQLVLFDTTGAVMLTGQQIINIGGGLVDMDAIQAEVETKTNPKLNKQPPTQPEEPEIKLSPLSTEFRTYGSMQGMQANTQVPIPKDLRAALLHPEDHDPLSYADSEALLSISETRKEQLVAEIPDTREFFVGEGKLTATEFLKNLTRNESAVIVEKEGFMTVKPGHPAATRANRSDRSALGTFIRRADETGGVSLDDLAAYALKAQPPMEAGATMPYLMTFAPESMQGSFGMPQQWDMLRFYGSLGQDVRNVMAKGQPVPFANFSTAQRAHATRLLFGTENKLGPADQKKGDSLMDLIQSNPMMGGQMTDFRSEPTEIMPNGLPGNGSVVLNVTQEPVAKLAGGGALFSNMPLGLDELAMLKFFKESPAMAEAAGFMPSVDSLKVGNRSVYQFTFHVSQDTAATHTLHNNAFDKNAATKGYAELPEDFRKKIDARMAEFKKLPFFDPAFFGGPKNIPPQ